MSLSKLLHKAAIRYTTAVAQVLEKWWQIPVSNIQEIPLTVRTVPTGSPLSERFKSELNPLKPRIPLLIQVRTSMLLPSNPIYDLDESVFVVPLQQGGTVNGIRYCSKLNCWQYEISILIGRWWQQNELRPACPNCRALWKGDKCQHCGYSLDDLDT